LAKYRGLARRRAAIAVFPFAAHLTVGTDLAFNRIAIKLLGVPGDHDARARGEKALPGVIAIIEGQLAKGKWILGNEFTLVDCD
jgi:glutathione S-transferase